MVPDTATSEPDTSRRESSTVTREASTVVREADATREGRIDGFGDAEATVETETTVVLLSIVGVIVGSLLPWVTTPETVYGLEGDGLVPLIVGLVALGVAYRDGWAAQTMMTAAAIGAFVAVLALFAVRAGAGVGAYVTLVAGAALTGAGMSGYRKATA